MKSLLMVEEPQRIRYRVGGFAAKRHVLTDVRTVVTDAHEVAPVVFHGREVGFVEKHHKRDVVKASLVFGVQFSKGFATARVGALKGLGKRVVVTDEVALGRPSSLHRDGEEPLRRHGIFPQARLRNSRHLMHRAQAQNVGENLADRRFAGTRFARKDREEVLGEQDEEIEDRVLVVRAVALHVGNERVS